MQADSDYSDASDSDQFEDISDNIQYQNEFEEKQQKQYTTVYLVPDHDKTTSNVMTRFEFARVIGIRATMIEKTGIYYAQNINPADNLTVRNIALIELKQKKCPLKIRRMIGNRAEDFNVNEMTFPNVNIDIWEYTQQ